MTVDIHQPYDDDNIFARILRGEIPCKKVYENDHVLAFHDINPQAPVHILVVPKGRYVSWDDFSIKASDQEMAAFVRAVGEISRDSSLNKGYRLIVNCGHDADQLVPHLHIHILGGKVLGAHLVQS
ncbi:MAG: histidine triad nucleotide-binding protein [Zymomonas mobilis subsp. pomaceae]|uniref:Histidine triad (HIT) protein n=1 Tax=Zymomonas mobilis subsp. pomaceae (strain ATCC 29192 / DSM 22645 / JCM 10191 / CCUG 17912 / NBRC 13757 / NCIMB 11200 / NRRL B-4491 / Barker I) TaxID=579138 RepID=F8EW77_ZYMMT|nr:histidine triad nucleotide-binding protein [Zymomonas mobilis]AEI38487.1 histidine triad (HIT) protein [Zymomonas mobilis subsp. pomaceae ATCC 29192]MDX5948176.1 histidine triad nucleotide-binding protein [Zymomonas mobilis subsp. pomaceae]GEB89884.1 histidine triad nucleotide-binding protein [Zymomonas mobilis subsp. pomaceae]